jgi:uncharacterized integral membrane protein
MGQAGQVPLRLCWLLSFVLGRLFRPLVLGVRGDRVSGDVWYNCECCR